MSRYAEQLCLVLTGLFIANGCSAKDTLGRLFHSPQQRATLDQKEREAPTATEGSIVKLNGVIRQGQRSTYWINGQPQPAVRGGRAALQGLQASETKVETSSGPLPLRVGETADLTRGERYRLLEDGIVRIHRNTEK